MRRTEDVTAIRSAVEARCRRIGRRVDVIVNYGSFRIDEGLTAAYGEMVRYLEDRYYQRISRYAISAFLRMKLGRMLTRKLAPHIFETQDEARAFLQEAGL